MCLCLLEEIVQGCIDQAASFFHTAVNLLLGAAREITAIIDGLAGSWQESSH